MFVLPMHHRFLIAMIMCIYNRFVIALFLALFELFSTSAFSAPISLKDALIRALKTSEEVAISREDLAKSKLFPYRALSVIMPSVDYTLDYIHSKEVLGTSRNGLEGRDGYIDDDFNHSSKGGFILTQRLIDVSFPVLLAQSKHVVKASSANLFYVSQEYLFQVVSAYYKALQARRILRINEEFLRQTKEHLDVARVRLEVGEVIRTDVLRAEVDVATATRNLIKSKNDLNLAMENLARYLHMPQGKIDLKIPVTLIKPKLPLEEMLKLTYRARADLKNYEEAIYMARNDKQLVFTRFFPSLDMQASWDRYGDTPYPQGRDNWSVFGVLTMPILDGGLRFIDLRDTTSSLIQATQRYLALKRDIDYSIREAYLNIITFEKTIDASMVEEEASRSNLELINEQYRVGLADSIDVVDAQAVYLNAQINLTNNIFDHEIAVYNLKRVVGLNLLDPSWQLTFKNEEYYRKWLDYLLSVTS